MVEPSLVEVPEKDSVKWPKGVCTEKATTVEARCKGRGRYSPGRKNHDHRDNTREIDYEVERGSAWWSLGP